MSRRFNRNSPAYFHPACLFVRFRTARTGTPTIQVGLIDHILPVLGLEHEPSVKMGQVGTIDCQIQESEQAYAHIQK